MTITSGPPSAEGGGALEKSSGGSNLADVVETVLDKGVVIDAQVSVSVVGIQLLEINARVVVASIDTYLRFAQAVDRLSIVPENQKGLPDLVEGVGGELGAKKATASLGKTASGLGKAVRQVGGAVSEALDQPGSDSDRERERRPQRRRSEEG